MIPVIQSIWWLIVLIGAMILIHELGHCWAARLFDVRVDVFSFGFGPRLFGFRRGETDCLRCGNLNGLNLYLVLDRHRYHQPVIEGRREIYTL